MRRFNDLLNWLVSAETSSKLWFSDMSKQASRRGIGGTPDMLLCRNRDAWVWETAVEKGAWPAIELICARKQRFDFVGPKACVMPMAKG